MSETAGKDPTREPRGFAPGRVVRALLPFLGLPLLVWLLARIGLDTIAREVAGANWPLLLGSLLFTPLILALAALRWKLLLRLCGVEVPFRVVFEHGLLGQFYGLVTPGKIGSFVRITLIAEDVDAPLGRRVLSVLLDRIGDVIGMASLGSGGAILLAARLGHPGLAILGSVALVLGLGGLAALAVWRPQRILERASVLVPSAVRRRVGWRPDAVTLPPLTSLLVPVALSLATWTVVFFQDWLVAHALSVGMPCLDFVLVMPLASMVGLIPITVSGFGTRDATVVAIAAVYGVAAEKAMGMSLLGYCANAVFPSLLGAAVAGWRAVRRRPQGR